MKKLALLPLLLIPFTITGCSLFGEDKEEVQIEEEKKQETVAHITDNPFKEFVSNTALINTTIDGMKSIEFFSDGTYVEDVGSKKVIVHTPKEAVIRDKEGLVKISDIKIDTLDQNLIFRDNKIVIQEVLGNFNPNDYADNVKVVKARERIIDINKLNTEDIQYDTKEYDKELYDSAFEVRATFVDHAKDTDERIATVISSELSSIMNKLRKIKEEELRKQASEEASREAETTAPTEPEHIHNFQPVYKIIHHEAQSHEEKYTVNEPVEVPVITYEVYDKNTQEVIFSTKEEKEAVEYIEGLTEQTAAYRSNTTTTTEYKPVEKTRTVVDMQAYDENVIDYYECSCGTRQ